MIGLLLTYNLKLVGESVMLWIYDFLSCKRLTGKYYFKHPERQKSFENKVSYSSIGLLVVELQFKSCKL